MKKGKNKSLFKWFLVFIFILALSFLLFNSNGLLEYWKATKRNKLLREQITETKKKIEKIGMEIDSLRTSDRKIEKVAREKYHMLKPNEEVLEIEHK